MRFIDNTLILDKEINELDRFVLKFIKVIEKHTDYVIISGYVSILLGRSRATEDIDIFIKPISRDSFKKLYDDLIRAGFWCLNAEGADKIYANLTDKIAVRFSEKEKVIPNFEVKIVGNVLEADAFNSRIIAKLNIGDLKISSLERQIAFKRYYLGDEKDIEDAKHIETLFKDRLDISLIENYKKMIESFKKK